MEDRYIRNIPSISEADQQSLSQKTVVVFGCGGLGGYVVEELVRTGIGHLRLVDGDVFNESNLNRQLLCTASNIGQAKSDEAAKRALLINPNIDVVSYNEFPDSQRAEVITAGADIVVDALDNISSRLILEDICASLDLPLVHGAVQAWNIQVGVIPPASGILHTIYKNATEDNTSESKSCLCPAPALCASVQVAETIKTLLKKDSPLYGRILFMDLLTMEDHILGF